MSACRVAAWSSTVRQSMSSGAPGNRSARAEPACSQAISSMNGGPPVVKTIRKSHSPIRSDAGALHSTPAAHWRSRIARSMSGTAKHTW